MEKSDQFCKAHVRLSLGESHGFSVTECDSKLGTNLWTCFDTFVHQEKKKKPRKDGQLWSGWLQNWYLPLMPVHFVLIPNSVRIIIKNLKLTHLKSITVETFVPSHRWLGVLKPVWILNRIKVGITFVMGNTAAEKSLTASAGNLKGNSLLAYFSSIRINPFRKRIIYLLL